MDTLSNIVKTNYLLYERKGAVNRVFSPARFAMRKLAEYYLPGYLRHEKVTIESKQRCDIIVSLTSFPSRIDNLWMVIQCMFRQSLLPHKIILWLSAKQFPLRHKNLPTTLTNLENDIFEIRFVDEDFRSHKKHFYAFKEFAAKRILLIDDDIFYPADMIERIDQESRIHPDHVICQYGYHMQYDKEGFLCQYNTWPKAVGNLSTTDLFFGSGGGTLIQPDKLYGDIGNQELFLGLTPLADDVWLNAMVRMAGIPIYMIKTGHILPVANKHTEKLANVNQQQNMNDKQINAISAHYKQTLGIDPFAKQK